MFGFLLMYRKYKENSGEVYGRSEGLAVASLDMFLRGNFSSEPNLKRVDGTD